MEEILLRFPHIGNHIFKELNHRAFFKSMEVSKSWNYFIKSERVMQKAYKAHKAYKQRIVDIIQGLTDEIAMNPRLRGYTPFHLAAERGNLPVCLEIVENSDGLK